MTAEITIEKKGRRHYLRGLPFALKDKAKDRGCKWDPDQRCWWTGKAEVATEIAELSGADLGLAGFPARLDSGEWGVRIPGASGDLVGKTVKVSTRDGKTWNAKVSEVVRVDGDSTIVRTVREASGPRRKGGGQDRVARQAGAATRRSGGRACRECGGHVQSWSQGAAHGLCHDCV